MKTLDKVANVSKRFRFEETGVAGDYDVYAKHRGGEHKIAYIKERKFKRISCDEWKRTGVHDYLDLIQSYAAIKAAESGKTGPL